MQRKYDQCSEKSIIMGADSILSLLAGRKSVTRRILRPQPIDYKNSLFTVSTAHGKIHVTDWAMAATLSRYWVGDMLWVKEAFRIVSVLPCPSIDTVRVEYLADLNRDYVFMDESMARWRKWQHPFECKTPIYMFRCLSRITLRVTAVHVERLQDITEEDAVAEGVENRDAYFRLFEDINGARKTALNPWVAAITFWNAHYISSDL